MKHDGIRRLSRRCWEDTPDSALLYVDIRQAVLGPEQEQVSHQM